MHQLPGDPDALRFEEGSQKKMAQRQDDLSFLGDIEVSGPQWVQNLRKSAQVKKSSGEFTKGEKVKISPAFHDNNMITSYGIYPESEGFIGEEVEDDLWAVYFPNRTLPGSYQPDYVHLPGIALESVDSMRDDPLETLYRESQLAAWHKAMRRGI